MLLKPGASCAAVPPQVVTILAADTVRGGLGSTKGTLIDCWVMLTQLGLRQSGRRHAASRSRGVSFRTQYTITKRLHAY